MSPPVHLSDLKMKAYRVTTLLFSFSPFSLPSRLRFSLPLCLCSSLPLCLFLSQLLSSFLLLSLFSR